MNKKVILLLCFLAITANFYGQRKANHEKIKTLKVAFITERLNLSSSEAQAFWPVYNEHEAKMADYRKKERSEIRVNMRNINDLSENDTDKMLQLALQLETEKAKLKLAYYKKMSSIIASKKTMLLMKAEEDFKRQLIRQYRHGKKDTNSIDGEVSYFFLDSDMEKVDRIIIENEIVANTESSLVSDFRHNKE